MPNWKKVITSGSNAELNSVKITGAVNAGTDTDKFLVLDAAGNVDFRTGNQVLSDIGAAGSANLSGTPADNQIAILELVFTCKSQNVKIIRKMVEFA